MGKIDTSEWGTFKLIDIGFTNDHGTRIKKSDRLDGDTIFLTAGKENQGIVGTIGNIIKVWHKPITIDMFGNAFYHDFDCAGDDNIYAFENNKLSKYVKSFIATVINLQNENIYSYTKQFRQNDVNKLSIKLPVDAHGNPDWDFMESYMRDIEARTCDKISRLERAIRYRGCTIDVSNWKGFKVGELFDIVKLKKKMSNSDLSDNGTVPVYSSTTANNGIFGYTFNDPLYHISDSIPYYVLFGDHTKSMFIVKNDFNAMDNVKILKPRIFNEYATKFILTSWLKSIPNLGYSRHWLIAKNCEIYLPSDKYGKPDYLYMQNYMLNIEKQMTKKLTLIL